MGKMAQHKLSSDFIVKNGNMAVAASSNEHPGQQKQNFLNLIQTQPVSGGMQNKAKFKQAKPLSNTRGKSVPQERPSNSQGSGSNHHPGMGGSASLNTTAAAAHYDGHQSATKSSTGIRISSQR